MELGQSVYSQNKIAWGFLLEMQINHSFFSRVARIHSCCDFDDVSLFFLPNQNLMKMHASLSAAPNQNWWGKRTPAPVSRITATGLQMAELDLLSVPPLLSAYIQSLFRCLCVMYFTNYRLLPSPTCAVETLPEKAWHCRNKAWSGSW
jgi:hypothetical protein